jgi:hypothetical protein
MPRSDVWVSKRPIVKQPLVAFAVLRHHASVMVNKCQLPVGQSEKIQKDLTQRREGERANNKKVSETFVLTRLQTKVPDTFIPDLYS